ncbi:YIP1 family protein [Aliiruegeria sabulilitoris]|uniref:YIP1 family protein n=1 Tax=Aliiruegeria sabulilitoris TaxID=1510458 RepID=UPI0008306E5D|nr:YIP1 family protein [Aliiruegeria sabulilitoris]NDR55822.1 YIP1 family protein [Pseudoruegeria sp. M32A2M]
MSNTLPGIPRLVYETIRAPRRTAEYILALDIPRRNLWEALVAAVLLTVVLVVGLVLAVPADPTDPASVAMQEMYARPIPVVIGQLISSVVTVYAITFLGQWLGGKGTLDGALALVAWHQFFLLFLAVAGMALGLVLPAVLSILLIAMIVLYFFVLTQFVCALHGFENAMVVFFGIIIAFLTLLVLVAVLTGFISALFFGVTP